MSPSQKTDPDLTAAEPTTPEEEAPQRLNLDVKIDARGACQRHVTVTIPREDIDRYLDDAFHELMNTATVPGFRPGRVPRKLVEARFRKEVGDQVKGTLLMDSIEQLTEEQELAAISEPDIDLMAVELPDEGPMVFEFDLEVRPEFAVPKWKGLKINRPVYEFTREDIDAQIERLLGEHGRLVPHDGPAESGDYIATNMIFKHGDQVLSSSEEEVIRLRPKLSFRDAMIEDFDKQLQGVKAGETREVEVTLSSDAPNEALRGQTITGVFEVLEVKRLELPELTPSLLDSLGAFESEGDLRDAIKERLERRLTYQQQQEARRQVLAALTEAADWELPPELLSRQTRRELERMVMELRSAGYSEEEIRAHANTLRQNSQMSTAQALKEHFVLERIAEEEEIDATPEDYDFEIAMIGAQSGQSARRVRAQLEKRGVMDALRNQIIERKTIELILSEAKFKDTPYKPEIPDTVALDQAAGGGDDAGEIPDAKYGDEATPLRAPEDHT